MDQAQSLFDSERRGSDAAARNRRRRQFILLLERFPWSQKNGMAFGLGKPITVGLLLAV